LDSQETKFVQVQNTTEEEDNKQGSLYQSSKCPEHPMFVCMLTFELKIRNCKWPNTPTTAEIFTGSIPDQRFTILHIEYHFIDSMEAMEVGVLCVKNVSWSIRVSAQFQHDFF